MPSFGDFPKPKSLRRHRLIFLSLPFKGNDEAAAGPQACVQAEGSHRYACHLSPWTMAKNNTMPLARGACFRPRHD